MFGFNRKNSPLLGIDISSTAIKLIELSRKPGNSNTASASYRVERFAIESLPFNAVVEKKIADPEMVGQCIRKAVIKAGTKTKRAAVAVAGAVAITKIISMSASFNDAELENQIQLEADQYITHPLEEVNLDFDVIGPTPNNPAMVDVLLAASRRENVDDRVAALEIAGLTATIVDIEVYAMENAISLLLSDTNQTTDSPVAVVDIGAANTTLYVFNKGQIIYTREQNFGGQHLKDDLQRRFGISREEATQKIIKNDFNSASEIEALDTFKDSLSQQINRALQFFYSGTTFNHVDRVILSGGSASLPRLSIVVEERIKLPISIANPFQQMSLSPQVNAKDLLCEAPCLMIAVGLALRGF
ncbi:pilus assembly protein PilM [Chromatium weissei]|nr:pilus assembly protein PilM [Chromatium weissei]